MDKPNPFIPAGSLMAERQRRSRAQFRVAVYAVLAGQVMLILGLLFQGCRSEGSAGSAAGEEGTAAKARTQPVAVAQTHPVVATVRPNGTLDTAGLIYVVKSGDNITHVAKIYGTTAQAIRSANGLKATDHLVVGQRLKMPADAKLVATSTTK